MLQNGNLYSDENSNVSTQKESMNVVLCVTKESKEFRAKTFHENLITDINYF